MHWIIKLFLVLLAVMFVIRISRSQDDWSIIKNGDFPLPSKHQVWRWSIFVIISTGYMYFQHPDLFFGVIINKPALFILILFVYTGASVLPQEWLYRVFYVNRYGSLIDHNGLATFCNALVFSLAHLFLFNALVLALTFLGGLLFYSTYLRSRSFWLVSLEHAVYGLWLFTIGAGDMLAFPS